MWNLSSSYLRKIINFNKIQNCSVIKVNLDFLFIKIIRYIGSMIAGLFHRVVLSSGSALSPWASVHDPNDLRLKVGEQIGCSTENDEDIADCLRGVPLRELMAVELPEIR